MNYYEYNEAGDFRRDGYDLEALKASVDELGGKVTDEYGNFVYGQNG